jgi:hypothetical protein
VVGSRNDTASGGSWIVRASDDGGDSWRTLLNIESAGSFPKRLAVDQAGNVVVSGVVNPTGQEAHWYVVRCTEPQSPSSWANSFNTPLFHGAPGFSRGHGVACDAAGTIFATGVLQDYTDESGIVYLGYTVGVRRIIPAL